MEVGVDRELLICPSGGSSWPGISAKRVFALGDPAIHVLFRRAKNVNARDIGAKQSFVASPGHDEWITLH